MIFHKLEKPPRRKTPAVDRKHPSKKSILPRKNPQNEPSYQSARGKEY